MKTSKTIKVLIPDAESGHALIVIRGLAEAKEYEVHLMAKHSNAASRYSRFTKSYATVQNYNDEIYLQSILNYAIDKDIDLILPIDESAHKIFSRNLAAIHRIFKTSPIPSEKEFEIATNKWKLSEFCESNNFPYPKSYYINNTNEIDHLKDLRFPLLIKPESGHGGKNISKLDNFDNLKKFLSSNPDSSMGNYIVQDFIEGYDIDMSLLAKNGEILAYTIQKGFIKRSNQFAASAGIEFLYEDKIHNNVSKLISSLNYSGIAHLDLRYDANCKEFKLIEINSRFWGSLTGSVFAGVNFPHLACQAGMGITFPVPAYKKKRYIDHTAAIKNFIKYPLAKYPKRVKFGETDLKYFLKDPVAEIQNVLLRRKS
jgi:predicted ATP-grasp superfamily ATP-dependent carboligase